MALNIPNKIIIHCSATRASHDVTVNEIRRWHKERGWSDIGYHFFIDRQGVLHTGRPITRYGAHTRGYNKNSIGICMAGGIDNNGKPEDNFTPEQYATLREWLTDTQVEHEISDDNVHGHYEFSSKACPSFDVQAKLEEWKV